jgi:conjugal transfer pilus assembly protein TraB
MADTRESEKGRVPRVLKGLSARLAGSRRAMQWLLAAGLVLVLLALAVVSVSLSQRAQESADMHPVDSPGDIEVHSITAPGAGVSDKDVWITKSESRLRNMAVELRDLKQTMQKLQHQNNQEQADSGISEGQPDNIYASLPALPPQPVNAPAVIPGMGSESNAGLTPSIIPLTPTFPQTVPPAPQTLPQPVNPAGGMLVVHMTPPQETAAKTETDKSAWLTVSFTPARLLNGLDAATGGSAQQNPQPVLMQVTDMTQMPNRYREDFKECFITGAGYGDISSERAYLRLEKLSCIDDDGHAIEEAIDGYVTGEDGKVGMRGHLVSKQGQVLAKALLAGIASGIGDAFTQSVSTQSISPLGATTTIPPGAAARAGVYTGVGKALNKLADFYIQQADKLYPVIEVNAGRSVDVIINKGVRLPQWNNKEE